LDRITFTHSSFSFQSLVQIQIDAICTTFSLQHLLGNLFDAGLRKNGSTSEIRSAPRLTRPPNALNHGLQGHRESGAGVCDCPIFSVFSPSCGPFGSRLREQLYCSIPHLTRERNAGRESLFKILYLGRRQVLIHHPGVIGRKDWFD
jgi:hypothetical protein